MTVRLSYDKARELGSIVDYKDYFSKYEVTSKDVNGFDHMVKQKYSMTKGAPLLANIEGTYIKLNDIPYLAVNNKKAAAEFVESFYKHKLPPQIRIVWKR